MRVAGIILTTIFEATGLIVWLILSSIFGVVVLFVGLLFEHFLAFGFLGKGKEPKLLLVLISGSETVIWLVWLFLFNQFGIAISSIVFFAMMLIQHTIEGNIFKGSSPLDPIFSPRVILHTIIEVSAAALWIYLMTFGGMGLIGAGVLVMGLLVEHVIQSTL